MEITTQTILNSPLAFWAVATILLTAIASFFEPPPGKTPVAIVAFVCAFVSFMLTVVINFLWANPLLLQETAIVIIVIVVSTIVGGIFRRISDRHLD